MHQAVLQHKDGTAAAAHTAIVKSAQPIRSCSIAAYHAVNLGCVLCCWHVTTQNGEATHIRRGTGPFAGNAFVGQTRAACKGL